MTMQFLNVDLEIGSRESLTALIVELVKRRGVHELYTGRFGGLARAHYEVHVGARVTADTTARALVRMVTRLSPKARRCWDRARVRDFNIGIQAGAAAKPLAMTLEPATVAAIASLGGRVVVTVYPPETRIRASRKRARRSPSSG